MTPDKVRKYFDRVIRKYNIGDIQALLDSARDTIGPVQDKAGPLLACVVNGIDTLGGMAFGFTDGSESRSVSFMRDFMGIDQTQGKMLYAIARCGLAHEGVPKLCLRFFVHKYKSEGSILSQDRTGTIWLNVTQLARRYCNAVDRIANQNQFPLSYVPVVKPGDATKFGTLLDSGLPDISEFCRAIAAERQEPERLRFEHGEIDHMSSSNPFLEEWLPQYELPDPLTL